MRWIAILSIFVVTGCAATKSETCTRAFDMRQQAARASGEEKVLLEAKAIGLEEACARERNGLLKTMQDSKRHELESRGR